MQPTHFYFNTLLIFVLVTTEAKYTLDTKTALTKIAFGSCNKNEKHNPLWEPILDFDPQMWIWLGDIIYADTWLRAATPEDLKAKFVAQKQVPGYKKLLEQCPAIIGIWDDHDFGKNNGGKEYPGKWDAQRYLLEFLEEDPSSPRWHQEGVYASYTVGPAGKRIKIYLLDSRFHRDDLNQEDILGEDQWKWFEKEVKNSDAQINIIAAGIQILPADRPIQEKWSTYPKARDRLFKTIYNLPGVIFLSGDVHWGELLKRDCTDTKYPYYEMTSSGMTHCFGDQMPLGDKVVLFNPSRLQLHPVYPWRNFGTIQVDWEKQTINLQLRGVNGTVQMGRTIDFSELDPTKSRVGGEDCSWERHLPAYINWQFKVWLTMVAVVGAFVASSCLAILICLLKRRVSVTFVPNESKKRR